jgi:hypothetical protein
LEGSAEIFSGLKNRCHSLVQKKYCIIKVSRRVVDLYRPILTAVIGKVENPQARTIQPLNSSLL